MTDCNQEETVINLLEGGAHYCFNLHDSPRILQVRLEAALRRHGRIPNRMLTQGSIRFDLQKRRVTLADKLVDLSPKEYELACYLFSNRGRVISNSELMTSIWSLPPGMDTRRIDTAACRVRKKLGLNAADGWELRRLRRVGYLLVQVEADQAVIGSNSVDAFQPQSADSQSAGSYGTTSNRRSGADHEKIAIAAIELASNTC